MRRVVALLRVPLLLLPGLAACSAGGGEPPAGSACTSSRDCGGGQLCRDGTCVALGDAGAPPADGSTDGGAAPGADGAPDAPAPTGCAPACADGMLCVAGTCVTPGPACAGADDCDDDQRCDAALGRCLPWIGAGFDEACTREIPVGQFAPTVQCELAEAPSGDPFPAHLHVLATPMVVDFDVPPRGPDEPPRPSIVAVFDDGEDGGSEAPTGVIRILDGQTCAQQAELGSLQLVSHSSPPALADLDGDGRAEIVAFKAGGGLVAFHYDDATAAWAVLWTSTQADGTTPFDTAGGGWAGPSVYDLDDDGVPEVLRGGVVLDGPTGRVVDASLGYLVYSLGIFPIVADVDGDHVAELVTGAGVWRWSAAARAWERAPYSATGVLPGGHAAIGDFGDFPGTMGWPAETPEIAVITTGEATVWTLDGTPVFGPVAIPGGGRGGPPTIADFDGDGRAELSTAGASAYVVFDLDCSDAPVGECASGTTNGILWSQPSQDQSSNVTGSSVFDFEGDGSAEVVYGDECFLRVYDGATGAVLFSQYRSSCTWNENPIVADVDGDYAAEIVIGNNFNCGAADSGRACTLNLEPTGADALFAGLRCQESSDCVSERCVAGLCRCELTEDCCPGGDCTASGFSCLPAPDGTFGEGNTCRATHPRGARGIRVYGDTADRWVSSRTIWNQQSYHVTNVGERGAVPATTAMLPSWSTTSPARNTFRANTQGDRPAGIAPDLTARPDPAAAFECRGMPPVLELRATVCNRGAGPVGAIEVGFYAGDPATGAPLACSAETTLMLRSGTCETVSCGWTGAPTDRGTDVWVVADDGAAVGECHERNNETVLRDVRCRPFG